MIEVESTDCTVGSTLYAVRYKVGKDRDSSKVSKVSKVGVGKVGEDSGL